MKKNHFDKDAEIKVSGVNAVKVAFKKRPQDLIKFYFSKNHLKNFQEIVNYCIQNKRAYKIAEIEELEKISSSTHHEGVVLLMKKKESISLASFLKNIKKDDRVLLLALENVTNPHNLGAIIRSGAHFGVGAMLVSSKDPVQTAAAYRTAEGGAEAVEIIEAKNFAQNLLELAKAGFEIIATSSHAKEDIFKTKLSNKVVFVMGEERSGLSKDVLKICTKTLGISGTGAVESLNVSVATAILCAEFWSQK